MGAIGKRIQIMPNLYLDEYIDQETYQKYYKKPHYLMGLINKDLPPLDQFMRERYGSVTINNWWSGGDREWSGLRTPKSAYYKRLSQHGDFCNASDKLFANMTAKEVEEDIKKNYVELFRDRGLTCLESGVTWTHTDLRYHTFEGYKKTGLLLVYP